jgi:V8-like Glu-specific endopeptidase
MNTFAGGGRLRSALFSVGLVAVLAACGGGGGGGESTSTAVSSGGTAVPISNLDASTYMIGVTAVAQNGGSRTFLLGTGFAIADNLIATNAHVTKAVLDTARQIAQRGERITAVTAFQSETGRGTTLLTAITHPSYSNNTRSPDVGLFISREALSAKLTLEDPQVSARLRKGDALQINGFPGDLFNLVFRSFQPGLSVPKASLLSCTVQTIENFDNRVAVDPANIADVDMYQHGCDTSGGTSGSPIMSNGKVIGLHNAGINIVIQNLATGQPEAINQATGSFGVNVKYLHGLIALNSTGVLEADKRFQLPPSDALIASTATGGQSAGAGGAGSTFRGTVSNASNASVNHQVQLSVAQNLAVTGTTSWPANPSLNLAARTFTLQGKSQTDGRVEFSDNTPEVVPGFRRGVYTGVLNAASGIFSGQYYELKASTNELFYLGDWTASR